MQHNFLIASSLVRRNVKLYFKDKLTFFMSMITPMILLLLFLFFLREVYIQSFSSVLKPFGVEMSAKATNVAVTSWLVSSILSTSAISISFCSCTLLVSDKIDKASMDLDVAPVKKWVKNISYLLASFLSTIIVLGIILVIGLIYLAIIGWYLTVSDVALIILTVILLTLFGSTLACVIFNFINTQAGISAVATLVSSIYGFICGAYMPLSQYPSFMASVLGINPGLYGTVVLKNLFLNEVLNTIDSAEAIEAIKDGFDLNYYFFGNKVSFTLCIILLVVTACLTSVAYLSITFYKKKHKKIKKQS